MLLDSYVRSILDDHIAKTMTFKTNNYAAAFGNLVHNIQVNQILTKAKTNRSIIGFFSKFSEDGRQAMIVDQVLQGQDE